MNSNNCIVSQVHIPIFDVQGDLSAVNKVALVENGIRHLRKYNKDAYIIFTGHGVRPSDSVLSLCDFVDWEDKYYSLNPNGTVKDMPAQYVCVGRGIQHALQKGYRRLLKTRGDCIIKIPNIVDYCERILQGEDKKILLTQQTGAGRIGDCFMYGDIDVLLNIWNPDKPPYYHEGLIHTGKRYAETFGVGHTTEPGMWLKIIRDTCAFRNVTTLGFVDLRWNYNNLLSKYGNNLSDIILQDKLDIDSYHWGRVNNYHVFDYVGNLIVNHNPHYCSEKTFYDGGKCDD